MARKKITDLDDGGVLAAGDYILIARDGANYKMDGAQIANTVSNVANNAASLAAVSTTVATHATDLTGVKNRLDTVEAASGDVANISNTLTTITGRVTTLESNAANTATTLANAVSRITTLESGGVSGGGATNGSLKHRYWRFVCLNSNNTAQNQRYFAIAEVEMRTQPGGNDLCVGGTAIARTAYTNNPAANAFDDLLTTQYETGGDTTHQTSTQASVGNWIGYDFGTPIAINVLTLKNNSNLSGERIISGMFQYSDDGTLYQDAWAVSNVDTANNAITTSINPNYTTTSAEASGLIPTKPPTLTTFPTIINHASGGMDYYADASLFSMWRTDGGNTTSGTSRIGARFKSISGSSWSATMTLKQPYIGVVGNTLRVGLMARESSTGKMASYVWGYSTSGNPLLTASQYSDTEATSGNTTLLMGGFDIRHSGDITIRMSYSNASSVNMTYLASANYGRTWIQIGQGSATLTPDQIGICLITVGPMAAPRCAIDVMYYSDPDV